MIEPIFIFALCMMCLEVWLESLIFWHILGGRMDNYPYMSALIDVVVINIVTFVILIIFRWPVIQQMRAIVWESHSMRTGLLMLPQELAFLLVLATLLDAIVMTIYMPNRKKGQARSLFFWLGLGMNLPILMLAVFLWVMMGIFHTFFDLLHIAYI